MGLVGEGPVEEAQFELGLRKMGGTYKSGEERELISGRN